LHVFGQLREVEAFGVVDAALPVGDRDDLRADSDEELGGNRADVAEPLNGDGRALDIEADVLGGFARDDHDAAAGGFPAAERSAELQRLAGGHRRRRVADVQGVGVLYTSLDQVDRVGDVLRNSVYC